ncbi:4769_t:CDS:2 [Entrophospora sp. SA101]|nr:4769_t:CDS:2 [Entrophospora sp. SA101]
MVENEEVIVQYVVVNQVNYYHQLRKKADDKDEDEANEIGDDIVVPGGDVSDDDGWIEA